MTKNRDTDADVHNERRLGERIGKLLRGVNPRAQLHAFAELSATVGRAAGLTEAEFLGLCALYFRGKAPLSAGADLNASAHSAASAVRTPVVSLNPAEPPTPGLEALPDTCCVDCGSTWFSHLVTDEETGEVLRVVCGSCGLKQAMGAARKAWSIREAGRVEREAFAQAASEEPTDAA